MEVQVEGLRFERQGRLVLDIPSLRLHGGRTTAILGPNGAGKTTLLRLVATLETPTSGHILLGGTPARPDRATRQQIAFVFQEQVFLRRSVRDNLELGLRLRGVPVQERVGRVAQAADLLGITAILDRRADRLSVGEGRRVSLARAMCLRAPLILLDEPLAGLDLPTYTRLLDELPRPLQASGATAVLVTHDRDEALRLAQDLVVLINGRVHAAGDKREVVTHPPDEETAAVLGYAVLDAQGEAVAVHVDDLKIGPGRLEFSLVADTVIDLVDRREIAGRIGTVRVRVTVPPSTPVPAAGEHVLVHTDTVVKIRR
jgi:ABC-type sugar transport system ATPase subunit